MDSKKIYYDIIDKLDNAKIALSINKDRIIEEFSDKPVGGQQNVNRDSKTGTNNK